MKPVVSIMAQGGMGAATAARLVDNGVEVRTLLAGRSAASAERAQQAGMKDVDVEAFVAADFVLSIVPPAEALPLARMLAPALERADPKPVYVDLNAISPETAMKVAEIVEATGTSFVDGGIIGGPPRTGYDGPVYYVSGTEAGRVDALSAHGLKIGVLDLPGPAASALKLSYAGITKGLIAIAATMMLAADRAGVKDALLAELAASQPALLARFSRSVPDMFAKAYRWVAEMDEIAAFIGPDRPEHHVYADFARLYAHLAEDFAGDKREIDALESAVREPSASS